jgi:protoporphyrinogen IX oxidase
MIYDWIRAGHLIFVMAWMAGLLMLPRLRVYQLTSTPDAKLFETMRQASDRLRRIILTPAMILSWALGLTMIWLSPSLLTEAWLHAKLLLVIAMTGLHGWFVWIGKRIDAGNAAIPERRMRMLNEIPFLLLIGIVVLAVAEPF